MPESKETIIIVGAGLSGLSCALTLQDAGLHPLILEASDGPGGRVRTDIQEGFLLDRGFQVYLDAYPNAGALFDDSSLNLQPFNPGALVYRQGVLHRVMDVFRSPQHLLPSLFAPVGSLLDKLQVARLRTSILKTPLEQIGQSEDLKTEEFLSQSGFSKRIIDTFFRAFYGGIFLERDLRTSSQMFEFTFKMFSEGSATLPAKGMGQLSEQLANRIPSEQIRYQTTVSKITDHQIHLDSQEALTASIGTAKEKRFQRFIGLALDEFIYPGDRGLNYTIIEIIMFSGRSTEIKKKLIKNLITRISATTSIAAQDLEIMIIETPSHNWGIRGLTGDELNL